MTYDYSILIVDDEEDIRFFLTKMLEQMNVQVTCAINGDDALTKIRETFYNIILLDLNLGGRIDGLRVLEFSKGRWPDTAVVILTAFGTMNSALSAIREGVDGFLLKPTEPAELEQILFDIFKKQKTRVALQEQKKSTSILCYKDLCIDFDKQIAILDGTLLKLPPSEFRLLSHLIKNPHRVITTKELVKIVLDYEVSDQNEARKIIKWYIHHLRKKIKDNSTNPKYIVNIRGIGYTLGEKN